MSHLRAPRACLCLLALLAGCGHRPPGEIVATGTLQVDEVDIGPLSAGRVVSMYVEEGDSVLPGDTLARLTQATLGSDLAIREARLQAARAQLDELERGARPEEIRRAEAQLGAAAAEAERTGGDLRRAEQLAPDGTISPQQLSAAQAAAAAASANREALAAALRLLQEGPRRERIAAARAEVASAQGAVNAVRATAGDLVLVAPVAGVVVNRHVLPGEVVAPGQAAVTLAQAERPWARIYVAERLVPYVRAGQPVEGALDGVPGVLFPGTVEVVSTAAEFTPRVALTERERADLVFGVKVRFAPDTTGFLKAGLPVTVTVGAAAR